MLEVEPPTRPAADAIAVCCVALTRGYPLSVSIARRLAPSVAELAEKVELSDAGQEQEKNGDGPERRGAEIASEGSGALRKDGALAWQWHREMYLRKKERIRKERRRGETAQLTARVDASFSDSAGCHKQAGEKDKIV